MTGTGGAAYNRPMTRIDVVKKRSIHLIDLENLLESPIFSELEALVAFEAFKAVADAAEGDHLVVATSHHGAEAAWFGCPGARRLVRSGRDGADLALVDVIELENLAGRYDRVVIGSGDGIFAFPAASLQQSGCEVTVVSRVGTLSTKLLLAVTDVRYLEPTHVHAPAAATPRRVG